MQKFSVTVVITVVMFFGVLDCRAEGYAGMELYPNLNAFFFAGKTLGGLKVDVWATNATDVGTTVGPKIGPVSTGVGASVTASDDGPKVGYVNIDLGFGFDFGSLHWQSYNLYQKGRGDVNNFILSRHWLSVKSFPTVGLVGHNIKVGSSEIKFFWGPYVQVGKMGIFSSNRICLTVNLRDTNSLWGAWVVDF